MVIIFTAYAINNSVMTATTKKTAQDKLKIFEVLSERNKYITGLVLTLILIYFGAIQFTDRRDFISLEIPAKLQNRMTKKFGIHAAESLSMFGLSVNILQKVIDRR